MLITQGTYQKVGIEQECQPVSKHFLCNRLSSSKQQLWMSLAVEGFPHQLTEKSLQNSVEGETGREGGRKKRGGRKRGEREREGGGGGGRERGGGERERER